MNYGANTLFVDVQAMAFLERVGLGPNWVEPSALSKARYILRGGRYKKLPSGPLSLFFGNFFSWHTKRLIIREYFLGPKAGPLTPHLALSPQDIGQGQSHQSESVYNFFLRHFGQEVCDYAVQPFLAGIYAGDAHQLKMSLIFPKLVALELKYKSLLKGLQKEGFGAGRRTSISFVLGMRELCEALADMTPVQGQTHIEKLERLPDAHWLATDTQGRSYTAAHVVLAVPAYEAAHLLASTHPSVAQRLAHIHYTGMAQVHLGFETTTIGSPLLGFGGLHPPSEGTFASGILWISSVLPMRAPAGQQLLVAFVGGQGRTIIEGLSDAQILDRAEAECRKLYHITAPATVRHLRRWARAIPQYDEHALGLDALATELKADNLYLQANYLGGVSVQDCIKKGLKLSAFLAQQQ